MNNSKLWMILGGSVAMVALIFTMMWWTATNKEAKLRTTVLAEQDVCKVNFDNMWKILSEQASVADEYKNAFAEIFPKIMEERYDNARGGALLSFIKESNPTFDVSLYSALQRSIAAERTSFTEHQSRLIDANREHRLLLITKPSSFFFNLSDTIHITLVTSSRTNSAYTTGEDNDVDLFKKR